jgi:hypothetical protein
MVIPSRCYGPLDHPACTLLIIPRSTKTFVEAPMADITVDPSGGQCNWRWRNIRHHEDTVIRRDNIGDLVHHARIFVSTPGISLSLYCGAG